MDLAPIILFTYNRPWHTEQSLNALMQNVLADKSTLYIYCDGPKKNSTIKELQKIQEVRSIIRKKSWCKKVEIIERSQNLGLADNIVKGVTEVLNKYEKIIVLEDDIVTSTAFLQYMNDALIFYKENDEIMHISGYFPPVKKMLPDFFFYNQTSCWGWATWKRAWNYYVENTTKLYHEVIKSNRLYEFNINDSFPFLNHLELNLNGKIKTWAIKWHASVFLNNGLCLHPYKSYVQNIGFDNSGVNSLKSEDYKIKELNKAKFTNPKINKENKEARNAVVKFNRTLENNSIIKRIVNKFKKLL